MASGKSLWNIQLLLLIVFSRCSISNLQNLCLELVKLIIWPLRNALNASHRIEAKLWLVVITDLFSNKLHKSFWEWFRDCGIFKLNETEAWSEIIMLSYQKLWMSAKQSNNQSRRMSDRWQYNMRRMNDQGSVSSKHR